MVGTLLKMIASPTINKKPLETTSKDMKPPLRKSPIRITNKIREETQQGISAYPGVIDKEDMECQDESAQNNEITSLYDHTTHEDSINDDSTDNSISFQCSCKVWSCSQCNKAFNSARALKIHEVKQHENIPKRYIKCSHCEEVFDHGNLLQIHLNVHHNIKVQCPQCKEQPKATNAKTLNQEPKCPVCGVKFDHDKLLKLHMEHYHHVSSKEATLSSSTKLETQDTRELSSEQRKRSPSPRLPEDQFAFYENNGKESNLRNSLSPREVHPENRESERKERHRAEQHYDMGAYQPRPIMSAMQPSTMYLAHRDDSTPPYDAMRFYPQGVRRRFEKRPLGRSQSLPSKQESLYPETYPPSWHMGNHPMRYGLLRDNTIDRAALEAVRNSLKEKLRTVEATLRRDETSSHLPLSPTLKELYEQQPFFHGREEELGRPYRPSVITPRSSFGGFALKRKAPPSDIEPIEKLRSLEKNSDVKPDPRETCSPSHPMSSFGLLQRESPVTYMPNPHSLPKVAMDDSSIPNMHREYNMDDQAKIFIKRGAPRCNRCQQTFSSKMEYLHHLISHREKDGLTDASPEEMEFIEDVKRSIEAKTFSSSREALDVPFRPKMLSSPERPSPQLQMTPECNDEGPEPQNSENQPEEKSSSSSTPNPDAPGSLGTETCTECKDVFADSASYQVHIEKRHMKPRCRECGLTFDHKNLLKIHMDCYHSTLDVLQCYYCGTSFKQRSAFLDHVTSHETQDINSKDRTVEPTSEPGEASGRRRWGRLVASAQLPSEKLDIHDKEHSYQENLLRDALTLKSHTKTKLRKTVSLSAYTDMINRQKRSATEFLHETRSKGDEAIGKEMRTRIFLPSFEDKMENLSRFAASSAQLAKKRVSPPPKAANPPTQDNNDYLFQRRNLLQPQDGDQRQFYRTEERPTLSVDRSVFGSSGYPVQKRKLVRLKRHAPVDEEEVRAARLGFPPRKTFVRDEVESLYQLRQKTECQSPEVKNNAQVDPLDHRNALVKIERVEVERPLRHSRLHEPEKSEVKERRKSPLAYQPCDSDGDVTITTTTTKHSQCTVSTPTPPPLIDIRRCAQSSSQSSTTVSAESSPTSSRPESPVVSSKSHDGKAKTKLESTDSSSSVLEPNETSNENKGKNRNSIKKLTKEALINSLSLRRRASAPDLYQFNRDSTEGLPAVEKNKKSDANMKPGSPKMAREECSSPPSDTKHHGSRSVYYTPRRQSERDVTCTQCGVSFGHKKLYKIHIDSYHGKQQGHECLQCGSKNFRDKDEFVQHLMSHQNQEKSSPPSFNSTANDQEVKSQVYSFSETEHGDEVHSNAEDRKEKGSELNANEEQDGSPSRQSNSEQTNALANDESLQSAAQLNNNTRDKKTTCFTCGKNFENGKQLEQHFSSHASISEDGRFCCVLCGKAFETHRKLEIHSRSHTGFKPHKCEQCGRCFPYYSSYYYHKMTHTKDRPHKCPICGKGFIQTRYLRSHLTTHKDGALTDEVESILRKAELNMNDETDEESSVDSPSTAEGSPAAYRANDEETATAEILCSFKRGLNCSAQNSDSESPANCPKPGELL